MNIIKFAFELVSEIVGKKIHFDEFGLEKMDKVDEFDEIIIEDLNKTFPHLLTLKYANLILRRHILSLSDDENKNNKMIEICIELNSIFWETIEILFGEKAFHIKINEHNNMVLCLDKFSVINTNHTTKLESSSSIH